jgi:hypothetical protein
MSFTTINQKDGRLVIVNVTEPGYALAFGVVVREATQSSDGSTSIQTGDEGTAWLQGPSSPKSVRNDIDQVWQKETPANQTQSSPITSTGCGSGMMNACGR